MQAERAAGLLPCHLIEYRGGRCVELRLGVCWRQHDDGLRNDWLRWWRRRQNLRLLDCDKIIVGVHDNRGVGGAFPAPCICKLPVGFRRRLNSASAAARSKRGLLARSGKEEGALLLGTAVPPILQEDIWSMLGMRSHTVQRERSKVKRPALVKQRRRRRVSTLGPSSAGRNLVIKAHAHQSIHTTRCDF